MAAPTLVIAGDTPEAFNKAAADAVAAGYTPAGEPFERGGTFYALALLEAPAAGTTLKLIVGDTPQKLASALNDAAPLVPWGEVKCRGGASYLFVADAATAGGPGGGGSSLAVPQATSGALTDNGGGTATGGTIGAIAAATAADTDASAASLESVNASLNATKNAIHVISTKYNLLVQALTTAGILQ